MATVAFLKISVTTSDPLGSVPAYVLIAIVNADAPTDAVSVPFIMDMPRADSSRVMAVTPSVPTLAVGVAHVASPRQNVEDDAEVPLLRFVTGRLPVTPVDKGKPVHDVSVPDEGVPSTGVVSVGDVRVLLVSVCVPPTVTTDAEFVPAVVTRKSPVDAVMIPVEWVSTASPLPKSILPVLLMNVSLHGSDAVPRVMSPDESGAKAALVRSSMSVSVPAFMTAQVRLPSSDVFVTVAATVLSLANSFCVPVELARKNDS